MRFSVSLLAIGSTLTLAVALMAPASADFPGRHPRYVHAMGDLRFAHAMLDHGDYRPGVDGEEDEALRAIEFAYRDIKAAGVDDGKNIDDNFIDRGADRFGRFHRALAALHRAYADVAAEEEDPAAVGLRNHALADINGAISHVRHALADTRTH